MSPKLSSHQGDAAQSEKLRLKVWGEYACFTRPEMKAERVSYPVMTPSAARGILEAIFWKPEFQWRVREIWVLKPIRYASLIRNEVATKIPVQNPNPFFADAVRVQRHTLALRDVAYVIEAEMILQPGADKGLVAYLDQFRRRVARGRCYMQPYLGCREFTAFFGKPDGIERPIDLTMDLGQMLGEIQYNEQNNQPVFFSARLEHGILKVPAEIYEGGVS